MKPIKRILSLTLALLCGFAVMQGADKDYTKYVNPWIGTGGHGHVFLGANVPFGYVQLGPTEHSRGWDWCSGYHVTDSVLIGFGHQHLSGTGIGDLGDVALLPVEDEKQSEIIFSHANETVRPGYYSILLHNPDVFVELTATQRAGMHRYTFSPTTKQPMIALNLAQGIGWDKMTECGMKMEDSQTISGYRLSTGWAKDQRVFFVAQFSSPLTQVRSDDSLGVFRFDNSGPLLVRVGLSAVSIDNARKNLEAEMPDWNFNGYVQEAQEAWNNQLSKIQIDETDADKLAIFYTSMYHTMTAPSVFSDVNGDYRGSDGKTHHGDFTDYTTFSLWDTYRSAHPLMTIIHPEMQRDIAKTMINICHEQGRLPVWHLMGNETDCMVGNPGVPVLADLVVKGYVADKQEAFEALKKTMLSNDRGQEALRKYGYLPYDMDPTNETVAKGLEYALAYDGVARVAKLLGKTADYKYFNNLSKSYKRYFDRKTQFMRALSSKGEFREPFNPFRAVHRQDDYTEGNAWQYTWLVPHDVHGLVSCFGSEAAFVNKFDSLFFVTGDMGAEASPDISGLIGQYAHGNEPSHHVIYMYDYVGQPWKTARLARQVFREMYRNDYDGLCGNEDVGAMSAWYVLSSLGLYQVEPTGGKYVFGSPLWKQATIQVGGGKTFTIKTENNSDDNIYIQSARLNGKPYKKCYLMFQDIVKGGELVLTMGPNPSAFGTAKSAHP